MIATPKPLPATFRIAVLGLWAFTNLELAYALLRVDERLRAYATASLTNVALTIAASVVLVVGSATALGACCSATTAPSTVGADRAVVDDAHAAVRRAAPAGAETLPGTLMRFGLPTVPAEASVYALSVVDRQYISHEHGAAPAGLYSIAVKFAGAVAFIVRAFQYAWPPLAYSVTDDAEAARLYGLVTTYYVLFSGWVVAGLTLEARWIVPAALGPAAYFGAYRAVPWVSLGWAMYGLWVVFLVIAGPGAGDTAQLPGGAVGPRGQRRAAARCSCPRYGIAGAGDRAVRRLRGDARRSCTCSSAARSRSRSSGAGWLHAVLLMAASPSPAICCCRRSGAVGFVSRARRVRGRSRRLCWRPGSPTGRSSSRRGRCLRRCAQRRGGRP